MGGDVLNYDSIKPLLETIDVAYYFVHLMGHRERDFYEAELDAAHTFARAATDAGVKRVVYMGGLGDNADSESKHLHSRHRTGEILRAELPSVIELRASMIIGIGSVGYDIIRNMVCKLPVILLPRTAETKTQPIALGDALQYLVSAATVKIKTNSVVDIGGPEILSYADIYREYAKFVGKKRLLIEIPHVSPYFAGKFLDVVTPTIHARIGAIMAESMHSEMVVVNQNAKELFPSIKLIHIREAFEHA
ncbi:oxidoreductase [Candidatus Saccharibacteria bacterium]|nr:oxidoreductase [Candidatus Saccharibacteria bacterium]